MSEKHLRPNRPPEFATDREWAESLFFDLFEAQDELHEAWCVIEDLRTALNGFDRYPTDVAKARKGGES